jgi:uncharacterized membrane protein YfcA
VIFFLLSFDQPLLLLRQNWTYVVLGFCGAVLGNISAVGGGIVFIPAMLFFYRLPALAALKIALAGQAFGMSSGAIGWLQRKTLPLQLLKLTVPGLLCGSAISSLVIHPNALLIKGLFGPVSIFLGFLTLVMIRARTPVTEKSLGHNDARFSLFLISFVGGLITGWVAIGEGELVAALLMLVYGVDAIVSIGIGVLLLAVNSIFLVLIHQFVLGGIPWEIAVFVILGCVFGARLAPYLSQRIDAKKLKIIFSIIAIGDGLMFIFQYALLQGHLFR